MKKKKNNNDKFKDVIAVIYNNLDDINKTTETFITSFQKLIQYYSNKEDLYNLYMFINMTYYYLNNFYELLKTTYDFYKNLNNEDNDQNNLDDGENLY